MENNYITDEWIDYYRKLRKEIKKREKQSLDALYRIQLFDRNRPSCSSGVTQVFVDDIEEFAKDQRRAWPLKMQIVCAFADLPGEAG